MLTLEQFLGFLLAASLITVSPGPDNLMVLGIGISKGRKQAIAFGLGCALGCLSHTLLAVAGVSALIVASPVAFGLLKLVGAAYLIWLGIGALRSAGSVQLRPGQPGRQSVRELFLKGLLANAINPKVGLFFLAFLPQFILPAHGKISLQMAALGVVFTAQAALLFCLLGYFSGAVGQWLNTRPNRAAVLDRVAGGVFVSLGLRLLVTP